MQFGFVDFVEVDFVEEVQQLWFVGFEFVCGVVVILYLYGVVDELIVVWFFYFVYVQICVVDVDCVFWCLGVCGVVFCCYQLVLWIDWCCDGCIEVDVVEFYYQIVCVEYDVFYVVDVCQVVDVLDEFDIVWVLWCIGLY